jgi:hypothetical protein
MECVTLQNKRLQTEKCYKHKEATTPQQATNTKEVTNTKQATKPQQAINTRKLHYLFQIIQNPIQLRPRLPMGENLKSIK